MPTATAVPAIRCTGLHKRYKDVVAVSGLDLEVRAGECFGLLGPNGAGKTTTVEMLEGLVPPDGGDIQVLGMRWGHDEHALRERLGVALQETRLADRLKVAEVIRLFRSFYRRGRTVEQVLEVVELGEKRDAWVEKLSGGQRQRLAIACALVGDPDMLFLDEPTTGLDPQSRRQLWDVVAAFKRQGGTVVLTTHYMEEAERLCDRVAVMDHGRVIALGTPRELIASLGAEEVVEFALRDGAPAPAEAVLAALPGVKAVRRDGPRYVLTVSEVHRAVPGLLGELQRRDVEMTELVTHHATLEDLFLSLTGRHLRDE
ncbi:MAG TPA: ABC transporter ATP-binding protein [Gemmatimonadales bacterium]|nr:ABC transporter ATP-binding protein [Gemmatimonadales bacterium]